MEEEDAITVDTDWETACYEREDGQHCNCWYDGEKCCSCGEK